METLSKLLEDPTGKRSDKTAQSYLSSLVSLHHDMGTSIPLGRPERWLSRYEQVERVLSSYESASVRSSVLVAILVATKTHAPSVYAHFRPQFEELQRAKREREEQQERSPRVKANWVTLDELRAHLKTLTKQVEEVYNCTSPPGSVQDRRKMFDHLMLSLYVLRSPLRNDWAELRVWRHGEAVPDDAKESNRLVEEEPGKFRCILHSYKTVRKYGVQSFSLPDSLNAIVRASLDYFPRSYLLSKIYRPDEPMSRNLLTKTFARVLPGKRLGSSLLRKVTVSETFADSAALRARKRLAAEMLHSPEVAQRNYEYKA